MRETQVVTNGEPHNTPVRFGDTGAAAWFVTIRFTMDLPVVQIHVEQVNLAGLPAISVPCGFGEVDGVKLPTGIQVTGKHFDEGKIFNAAYNIENK